MPPDHGLQSGQAGVRLFLRWQDRPVSQPLEPPAAGRPPSSRGNPALGDIVRSVLVLAMAVLAVVWIGGGLGSDPVVEPEPIDVRAVARQASDTATYPLLVPSRLPQGWRATQARWDPAGQQWHLGWLTENDAYVGLEQARRVSVGELVETFAESGEPDGEVDVGGVPWRVYVDTPNDRTALLRSDQGVTTMVLGSPPRATLVSFADTLSPMPGGGSQSQ
jgi:hypothetical protein